MAKGKRKNPRNKGITRVDSGSNHRWDVNGYKNGKIYSKSFSDLKCRGKRKAQKEARQYRDELHEKLAQIPTKRTKSQGRWIISRNTRNTTGVLGVSRLALRTRHGTINECYTVTWSPSPGVQKTSSISVRKYGEEKAFKMAVALRRKMLREIHGPGIFLKMAARQKGS